MTPQQLARLSNKELCELFRAKNLGSAWLYPRLHRISINGGQSKPEHEIRIYLLNRLAATDN